MYTITANIKAKKGDKVLAYNYRKSPGIWEKAIVSKASASLESDLSIWYSYEVVLERRSEKGNTIWLFVGNDRIKPISDESKGQL